MFKKLFVLLTTLALSVKTKHIHGSLGQNNDDTIHIRIDRYAAEDPTSEEDPFYTDDFDPDLVKQAAENIVHIYNHDSETSAGGVNSKVADSVIGNGESNLVNTQQDNGAAATTPDIHGNIKMGSKFLDCDTGKDYLWLDWDNSTDIEYTCHGQPLDFKEGEKTYRVECLDEGKVPPPIHTCMQTPIVYTDIPPRGGSHRPNWPVWGEYLYCPPERWVHSLEHGAAVFLYHPCAPEQQIDTLRHVARSCLRKHVITPYRHLPENMVPFAIVTWGCRIVSNYVDITASVNFIRAHAQQTYESSVPRDGDYDWGLLTQAELVSDLQESTLCPMVLFDADHMNHSGNATNELTENY